MSRRSFVVLALLLALAGCSTSASSDGAAPKTSATPTSARATTEPPPPSTTTTTTSPDDSYVAALTEALSAPNELTGTVTDEVAACVGEAWIGILGPEHLAEAGIDPDDLDNTTVADRFEDLLDPTEAADLVPAMEACGIDVRASMAEGILDADAGGATPEQLRCMADHLSAELARKVTATAIADGPLAPRSDDDLLAALTSSLSSCITG